MSIDRVAFFFVLVGLARTTVLKGALRAHHGSMLACDAQVLATLALRNLTVAELTEIGHRLVQWEDPSDDKALECKEVIEEEVEKIVKDEVELADDTVCRRVHLEFDTCRIQQRESRKHTVACVEDVCQLKNDHAHCAQRKKDAQLVFDLAFAKGDCGPFSHTEKIPTEGDRSCPGCSVSCEFGKWDEQSPDNLADECVAVLEEHERRIWNEFVTKQKIYKGMKDECTEMEKNISGINCEPPMEMTILKCKECEQNKIFTCDALDTCWNDALHQRQLTEREYRQTIDSANYNWKQIQILKCKIMFYFDDAAESECIAQVPDEKFPKKVCDEEDKPLCIDGAPWECKPDKMKDYKDCPEPACMDKDRRCHHERGIANYCLKDYFKKICPCECAKHVVPPLTKV